MTGIRIVLADDHKIVREGLRHILEDSLRMKVVAQAENGRQAVTLAHEHRPDIVVLDVTMPELNGVEATRQIVAGESGAKVIILSMHTDRGIVSEALSAGALGYLLKDCEPEDLESAIRSVLQGRIFVTGAVADVVLRDYLRKLDEDGRATGRNLSPKEKEVLQLIAEGKSTKETAGILKISVSTVESHRQHIMDKLQLHSVAELTKYAIREGLTSPD